MKAYIVKFYGPFGDWNQTIKYSNLPEAKAAISNWIILVKGNSYQLIYEVI